VVESDVSEMYESGDVAMMQDYSEEDSPKAGACLRAAARSMSRSPAETRSLPGPRRPKHRRVKEQSRSPSKTRSPGSLLPRQLSPPGGLDGAGPRQPGACSGLDVSPNGASGIQLALGNHSPHPARQGAGRLSVGGMETSGSSVQSEIGDGGGSDPLDFSL
jgi:hypothetical protein